jgi:integrase
MPRLNLTEKAIVKMKAPDPSGKQVLHWDTDIKGLAVICSGVSNSKTFICQRDLPNGKTRRLTVGAVNALTLEQARQRAADLLDDLRRGHDPKTKAVDVTLQAALDSYLAARPALRPASINVYRRIEHDLKPWCGLPLRQITDAMVESRHRSIAAEAGTATGGTSTANRAMRTFRILWNYASERAPDMPPNPTRLLKRQWFPEKRRERLVRDEELPRFYAALRALPHPVIRDYLTLMLFTGLRRTEAARLRWENIELARRVLTVPAADTKAGKKLELPLSDYVYDLLVARRAVGNAGYVFPGKSAGHHIITTTAPLRAVAKACGVLVAAHDLRRTFITIAESADISPLALRALVNHSLGSGTHEGYVIMNPERLREPTQRIANRLKELCGIADPAGNVTRLRRSKPAN